MAKLGRFSLPLSGRVPCRSKPARPHRTASTSSRQTPARRQARRASSPRRRELPISDAAGALGSGSGLEDSSHTTLSFQRCPSTVGMAAAAPEWATKEPCLMGIDEAGRGPVLGPMVYGCMYCARSYHNTLATLEFADSKTLKEEKREELFENLKANSSIGWEVDVICPKDLSAKMLKRSKVNLNEISHNSAMGLIKKVLEMGVLLAEVYIDTVGDPEKYRIKMTEKFPGLKFVVAKKADSLYPVVSGASIVAKVTRDRTLRNWVFDETAQNMHMNTGSGYPADPGTKQWLEDHKHPVFGFPTLVRFSWGTCTTFFKDAVEVTWESDELDEDGSGNGSVKRPKRQVKLSSLGFTGFKNKSEEIESCGKGRCKFFQARKLELVKEF